MFKFLLPFMITCACSLAYGQTLTLAGQVMTEYDETVGEVQVELLDEDGQQVASYVTDCDGTFIFSNLESGVLYTVQARKDDYSPNGNSAFDIVLISRYLLGSYEFDSPYSLAGADIDESGTVSILDLMLIRAVILGILESYPGEEWVFFRPGNLTPSAAYDVVLNTDMYDFDLITVKKGDVNGSAVTCQ